MESPVKRIFKLNLIVMRLLGFYPPQKYKEIYRFFSYAVYVCFTIPVPTLATVHLIVGENIDLAQVVDSSFMVSQVGCFIVKLIPFIFYPEEIRKIVYMLEWPVFSSYSPKQDKEIIEKCVKVCKRNTWLFLGFCVFSFIIWSSIPFLESAGKHHKFPIEIWLPFEATSDVKIHVFVFIFIVLGVGNGAASNGAIDPLIAGMACFAATQLRVLKDNLKNLGTDAEQEISSNFEEPIEVFEKLKNKIIYEKIGKCIQHHIAIINFIQHYEEVFSPVVFTQFMASVLVICISCLQLSMVEPFTFTFFFMISFLVTMLLEIFLYCYFGSSLFEESNSLTTAIYMGTWYEYDLKSRKALIILMERSKKPITVTAGKILDLSLVTFTTILRRAYSLLAVLKNYDKDIM